MRQYLLLFITAFSICFIVTPYVARLAFKISATDKPSKRKVHGKIMPRLGGLGVYAGFMTAALLLPVREPGVTGVLLGATAVFLLGVLDDIRGISPRLKLAGQIIAAAVVVAFGVRIEFINNPFSDYFYFGALSIPVTIFWIVAVTNAINLIDGLDGLAAGITFFALLTFSFISTAMGQQAVALLAFALAASVLAFLRYNFFPAKIFLGDSGSMFLGFMVAVLAVYGLLKGVTMYTFIVPIMALGVPIFDTCFAVFRRCLAHKPIFQADKKHLHHRLLSRGLSHPQAVLVMYFISLFFSVSALWMVRSIAVF